MSRDMGYTRHHEIVHNFLMLGKETERKRNDNRNVSSNERPLSPTLTLIFSGHIHLSFQDPTI